MRAPSGRVQLAIAAGLYLLTVAILTWPMPLHPGTWVFSDGGDAWAEIATLRELGEGPIVPFVPNTIEDFAAPEGYDIPYALYVAMWVSVLPKWLLATAFGPVAAFNAWSVAGFLASGVAMFLLARRVTGSFAAALIAGWAVAFFPYAVINGRTHLEFAHSWPFALLIWRMLVVHERPTVRNGLVAGAAAVVCLSFNAYFLLIGGVAYAALIAGGLLFAWRDRVLGAALRAHAAGAAVVAGVLAVYAGLNATAGGDGEIRDYDLAELYVYSSRALHYVVPHPGSKLFLGAGDGWWETHAMSGLAESGHYLGLTVLALALVAVGAALLGRLSRAQARVTWLIAAAGVLAALFSAPPTFQAGGVTIHMPSWFVFEVLPTWRVYSRFGLLVMTAAALLAAIGLARLLRGRSPAVAAVLAAVVGTLVVLDLWTHPSPASSRVPAPAVYEAVEDLPPGIVAEYPLFQNAVPEYQFALYQGQHDHPILNYYNAGTRQELRALWIADLEDPDTAGQLALLGVRYVVLTLGPPPAGVPAPGEPGRGFRRLREQDGKAVYEVTAAPAASLTWPARGFAPPEGERDGRFAWMTEADGEIDVLAGCRLCAGSVRLRVASFLRPRRVRIRDAGGRVRWEGTVGGGAPRSVEIPVRFGGELRLELEASPGPQSVRESTGAPDPRDLAIRVEEPRFVPAP